MTNTNIDIESQEIVNNNNISKCKKRLYCFVVLIIIFCLSIGFYAFVMLKNPLKLLK